MALKRGADSGGGLAIELVQIDGVGSHRDDWLK